MADELTQAERNDFHAQFGPMLYEAMFKILLRELNAVRTQTGLVEKMEKEVATQIQTELNSLTEYDWMKEQV